MEKKSVTNSDIISMIAKAEPGMTLAMASRALKNIITIINDTIADGNEVRIRGIGTFKTQLRPARVYRNLRTGDPVESPAKTTLKFKAGKDLTESAGKAIDKI